MNDSEGSIFSTQTADMYCFLLCLELYSLFVNSILLYVQNVPLFSRSDFFETKKIQTCIWLSRGIDDFIILICP